MRGMLGPTRALDRVGIVMLSATGDVVWTLPVVNAIKRAHPNAHVTWTLHPGPATLVDGHPSVDEIVRFDRSRGWRGFRDVRRELASRPFDVVLDLQTYFKAGLVTAFARAPVKLGFDRARARDLNWLFTTHRLQPMPVRHMQDQFLEFPRALGIDPEPVTWELGPWPEEREWQREFHASFDRPVAALVIATTKPEKDWPAERWAEIADILVGRYGLQPVLVGGRSERELRAEAVIRARARHAPVSALGSGLRRLVSILDGAAVVISPDTGPMHIAAALGRPVIALMGFTNPKRTGPWRCCADLLVDAFANPGERYDASAPHRPGRMQLITVADVVARLEVWRERYAGVVRRPNS